jgi:hypothetical protein
MRQIYAQILQFLIYMLRIKGTTTNLCYVQQFWSTGSRNLYTDILATVRTWNLTVYRQITTLYKYSFIYSAGLSIWMVTCNPYATTCNFSSTSVHYCILRNLNLVHKKKKKKKTYYSPFAVTLIFLPQVQKPILVGLHGAAIYFEEYEVA